MGSIWKAVTGFFKSNNNNSGQDKMESGNNSSISLPDEKISNDASDSDADDEDFVPNEAADGAESEENSDGDDDDVDSSPSQTKKTEKKSGKKRKATSKPRKSVNGTFKRRKFQRNQFKGDSDDDEDDANFIVSESRRKMSNEDEIEAAEAEALAAKAKEAEEKAETDRLWAEFLNSVNEEKEKRKRGQERTVEKVVNKVVDFAGEKISVQEKVKVTVTSSASNSNDITNNSQDSPSSSISTVALSDVSTSNASSSTATTRVDDEPVPGPSSALAKSNGTIKPKPRRGGISILGNDPETIGLDELEKKGLSGLLKAFQNKAAAAKRIGTLEKSKLDWEQYKRTQGLEEELTHHNRSRDTYIDKQEFLQRTDYRQFEIEKNMRATARSRRLAN